jgi:hypothetical protein
VSPSSLFRLSGLALVLAAAMFVIAEMLAFSIFVEQGVAYDLKQIAQTGAFLVQSLLTVFAGMLLLGGMVGLYVRQSEAAGKLGLIGFLLAFFGTALLEGDFYTNTFVTPLVALEAPWLLDNPLAGFLQVWLPFDFTFLALSWLLLAVGTVRARVYPRAASWSLLVGTLVALVPAPVTNIPFEVTLGWLGFLILKSRDDASARRRSKARR